MKFTCEKTALVNAISIASRTVAQKSTIPALEGIYIRAGVKLTLSGYNLETGITISVDANIEETGACIMPSRLFFDIIRKLPDDTVSISVDENPMKTKRLLALLSAGALSVSMLAGCGSTAKTDDTASGSAAADTSASADSDLEYVKSQGKLVVGITDFAPMDYKEDGSDEWIGFDADMAKAFAESIGVEAEFLEINWNNKVMELDGKGVDAVWNGMTLTDEVKTSMNCSSPYATNAQVVVVPSDKADAAKDLDGVKDLSFAVEAGSAGAAAADALGLTATEVQSQADALMEVAAGTSDACVIDLLMAGAMIGEGTSYPNLVYTLDLNETNGDEPENYVVGFRKDSDLTAAFNDFYKSAYEDGTVEKLAEKYGVQEAIVAP